MSVIYSIYSPKNTAIEEIEIKINGENPNSFQILNMYVDNDDA